MRKIRVSLLVMIGIVSGGILIMYIIAESVCRKKVWISIGRYTK